MITGLLLIGQSACMAILPTSTAAKDAGKGVAILNPNFVFVSALPWGQNSTCNDPGYENQGCIQRMTWSAFHNAYDDPEDPDYDSDFFMKASDEPAKGWLHWGLIGQLRNLFNSDFDP